MSFPHPLTHADDVMFWRLNCKICLSRCNTLLARLLLGCINWSLNADSLIKYFEIVVRLNPVPFTLYKERERSEFQGLYLANTREFLVRTLLI